MNIIKRLSNVLQFLDTEGSNLASEAWIDLDFVVEKITPRYSKGDIVRHATPPNQQTYEVVKTLYDFEGEEEYCLITSDNLRFALTVRSSELERIE